LAYLGLQEYLRVNEHEIYGPEEYYQVLCCELTDTKGEPLCFYKKMDKKNVLYTYLSAENQKLADLLKAGCANCAVRMHVPYMYKSGPGTLNANIDLITGHYISVMAGTRLPAVKPGQFSTKVPFSEKVFF